MNFGVGNSKRSTAEAGEALLSSLSRTVPAATSGSGAIVGSHGNDGSHNFSNERPDGPCLVSVGINGVADTFLFIPFNHDGELDRA